MEFVKFSTDVQITNAIEQMMTREQRLRQERQLIENCWDELLS